MTLNGVAQAQQVDRQACLASPGPDCIIALALEGASDNEISNLELIKELAYAGKVDLATEYLANPAPTRTEIGTPQALTQHNREVFIISAANQIVELLRNANREAAPPEETKAKLLAIETSLSDLFAHSSQDFQTAKLYEAAGNIMRRGVESAGYNMFISGPSADVMVRSRRLRKRYGVGLDVFLDRWKDVKGQPLRAIEYARFLFALGRNEEIKALVSSIEKDYKVDRFTIYCFRAEDWLELVGPSDLDPIVKGTGCHNTRANIALRLARMGDHGLARSISYELLAEFREEQWKEFESMFTFVPMTVTETLHPLAKALVQIGDVEAARQLTDRWRNYRRHGNGLDLLLIETGQMDEAAKELEIRLASQDFDGREYLFPAFEFYRLGKWERMAEMLSEKKMQIPFDKAIQIYEDALEKGKAEETYVHLEKTLGLKDAYLLHYINLTREMRAGDEQAARKTMSYLIEKEKLRPAPLAAAHYLGLLRLSVAMDDKELSLELVRLILDKILTDEAGLSSVSDIARTRRHILTETAAIYAQLLH